MTKNILLTERQQRHKERREELRELSKIAKMRINCRS